MWANDIPNWEALPFAKLTIPDGAYVILVTFRANNVSHASPLGAGGVGVQCAFDDVTNGLPQRLGATFNDGFEFALSNNSSGEVVRAVTFHDVETFARGADTTVGFSCTAGANSPSGVNASEIVFSAIRLGSLTTQ
jgi:hypothetical protein